MPNLLSLMMAGLIVMGHASIANAIITGGAGNEPIRDPGWPVGATTVFNTKYRIAWWEDPPFGGGCWHSECQGDADKLSRVMEDFAKIDYSPKKVIVHDGIKNSFWLDPNHEKKDDRSVETDWVFVVWQKDRWDMQKNLPRNLSAIRDETSDMPTMEIHVYTGGDVEWKNVKVPEGLEVIDNRLEAHGFKITDGKVVQGKLVDLASKTPLVASISLESIEPQSTGGYKYEVVETTKCDEQGRWTLKNIESGWFQIVARCDGYVPRVLHYIRVEAEPGWEMVGSGLAKANAFRGRVVDDANQPLADANVRLDGALYESPDGYSAKSNERGEFEIKSVPAGTGSVWVHREGYCRPGLGLDVTVPCDPIDLQMKKSGAIRVYILFSKAREGGYIVNIRDARGESVGRWGGGGNINEECWIDFKDIPPGKYILHGQPNPGSTNQKTDEVEVDIIGGKKIELEIQAKE